MGIIKYIQISCDFCGQAFHGHSYKEVISEAREGKWSVNGKVVKCDICKKKVATHRKASDMKGEGE
jgi:hypothetical protein